MELEFDAGHSSKRGYGCRIHHGFIRFYIERKPRAETLIQNAIAGNLDTFTWNAERFMLTKTEVVLE